MIEKKEKIEFAEITLKIPVEKMKTQLWLHTEICVSEDKKGNKFHLIDIGHNYAIQYCDKSYVISKQDLMQEIINKIIFENIIWKYKKTGVSNGN